MVILVILSAKKTLFFHFMRWWLFKKECCFCDIFQELSRIKLFLSDARAICIIYTDIYNGPGRERPESMKGTFPKISTFHDFTVPGSWAGGELTCGDLTTRNKMRWTADKCGIVRVWKLIWSIEIQRCTSRKPTSHFLNINLPRSDL